MPFWKFQAVVSIVYVLCALAFDRLWLRKRMLERTRRIGAFMIAAVGLYLISTLLWIEFFVQWE
jgi:multisubunit Na+/H+ antiporter MnhB subunit